MFILLGKIDTQPLEQEFGQLETDEVIVTDERMEHIKEHHPQDVQLFIQYAHKAIQSPDLIIKDVKNSNTVFMVKCLEDTNLNIVIKLALEGSGENIKNSVISFYRIRHSNLKKLQKNNKVLYKRE
ncbi:MAG: hypothetical protein J1F09_06650 [Oscillospiraceae bacterium]|nr:hypothetical protein [Oscillospiraceae bacterium]